MTPDPFISLDWARGATAIFREETVYPIHLHEWTTVGCALRTIVHRQGALQVHVGAHSTPYGSFCPLYRLRGKWQLPEKIER